MILCAVEEIPSSQFASLTTLLCPEVVQLQRQAVSCVMADQHAIAQEEMAKHQEDKQDKDTGEAEATSKIGDGKKEEVEERREDDTRSDWQNAGGMVVALFRSLVEGAECFDKSFLPPAVCCNSFCITHMIILYMKCNAFDLRAPVCMYVRMWVCV